MVDIISKKRRSQIMAAIKSRGNKTTEIKLAAIFRRNRISGWRRCYPLFGNPDFVFPKQRIAVFVDGCFWHGCRWHCRMPKSRQGFWALKITGNKDRDRKVGKILREKNWKVIRLWEHSLDKPEKILKLFRSELEFAGKPH
jgi:DNA mismatch endonuclease (patch repair protein)